MFLTSLLLTPILGVFAILVNRENGSSLTNIKVIALSTSILNFFISLVIFILFDFSTNQFQFVQEYHEISYFDFYLGVDGLSIYFVLLTTIIIPISLLSNWKSISRDVVSYVIIILLLESLLLAVFLVLDILLFYIFFESILPPLFILIGIFGSDNRVKASFYLFLYTLLGSLFLLLSILAMSSIMSTTDFDTLFKGNFIYITQLFLFYGIFIAFAVKTPTIFLNTWLLKAHVESPLGGSIILAAIVLKLSLYGILRLILPILPKAYMEYTYIIFLIGVITIIYASLSTLRTIDIKELIAYSSVSHAAVYLLGVFSNSIQGIEGAITLGIAHGFVSPGLFICAGGVLYDRSHTRVISFYRGVAQVMPLFAILFFILCLANCGAPLTLNFIGEFLSLYGVFETSPFYGILASSSIIWAAIYSVNTFQRVSFSGSYSSVLTEAMPDLTKRELTILMLLIIPTVILGIYPAALLDGLHYSVSTVLYHSDTIVAFAGAPLATEQTEVLARAREFEVTAAQNTSSSETLRELSKDNPEVLNKIVKNETAAITDSKKAIVEELTRVLPDSPGDAMQFTQQITFVNKTAQRAIDELNSAAETALEQIDYEQPFVKSVLLLLDIAIVDCLVYYAAALPVLVKLCLHKQYRELVVFYALWYKKPLYMVILFVIVATVTIAVYSAAILDGLDYIVSALLYHSDTIVAFAGAPFGYWANRSISQSSFEVAAVDNAGSAVTFRELSKDNPELLHKNIKMVNGLCTTRQSKAVNLPKPHLFSSIPLQSGIFSTKNSFIIGLVSSIITGALGYIIRLILLKHLEYDVFTNLDNWIPSLAYFSSLASIRFTIREWLKGNDFLMSYCGDPTEVSNNKYAKVSLPIDNNAAANNSSMQQPTNPVGDSSNTNPVGDSSNTNPVGDSSNTNPVGYYPSTDPRFALQQLALKKLEESKYWADQAQEWEYTLQDFLRNNPKPQPLEQEETHKEWQKEYEEICTATRESWRNADSEYRMYHRMHTNMVNGVNTIAESSSQSSSTKRIAEDPSMSNNSSSRFDKRGRGI